MLLQLSSPSESVYFCTLDILLIQQPSSFCTSIHIQIRPLSSVLAADRYEAEQLPQTVTSRIDPRAFDAQRTDYVPVQDEGNLTAAECIPSRQWLTEFLADFAGLRSQLHRSLAMLCQLCAYTTQHSQSRKHVKLPGR